LLDFNPTEILGEWEGYEVEAVRRTNSRKSSRPDRVRIKLSPREDRPGRCSGCGRRVAAIHDTTVRVVRDLPILGAETDLVVPRRRLTCPRCGPKLERLSWLVPWGRVTARLAESVGRLCQHMAVKHVGQYYGLSWDRVKGIDKRWLRKSIGEVDLSAVQLIAMDEFAIQKGHRYATVIVDAIRKRVLWVGRGRRREDIRPFFELLGPEGCSRIQAVAMDMNAAYLEEVRAHCPQTQIVYDLFHVVARYGREVIDRVRVDEANRLRRDPRARTVIKGSRWLLLRNYQNIDKREDRVRLQELLQANKKLATVYILKDDLKHLWDYHYPGAALRFWKGWYDRAIHSRIEPLVRFARNLKAHLATIVAHCRWRLSTSLLEGINNKIKVIKRMAYGFRDDEYFFLKIRAAFPGIPG
jgi:transposase